METSRIVNGFWEGVIFGLAKMDICPHLKETAELAEERRMRSLFQSWVIFAIEGSASRHNLNDFA